MSDQKGNKAKEKISLEKCKEILNAGETKYTDEQIEEVRNFLYQFAQLTYESYTTSEKNNLSKGL